MNLGEGLIVDLFAGGGGASTGIEKALGRPVDIAINHDAVALAVHKANHPHTQHVEEDIWKATPEALTRGRRVALLWASPDCTHFSVAKGGKPRKKKLRTLAWAVYRWARATRPDVIFLENVKEFQGWGPLTKSGDPDKRFIGKTFRIWIHRLQRLGYVVEHRLLDASYYGARTRRKRLFIVARRDGKPIVWPEFTHGPGRLPVRTAAECIDWTLPCPSIFDRKRPLAEKTQWRIAQGVKRFVIESPQPFIVGVGGRAGQSAPTAADAPIGTITAKNDRALVAPHLVKVNHGNLEPRGHSLEAPMPTVTAQRRGDALVASTLIQTGYGERKGQLARVPGLNEPLGTIVAQGRKHGLVTAFFNKHFGGVVGHELDRDLGAITSRDHHSLTAAHLLKLREEPVSTLTHVAQVRAFLLKYYGTARSGQSIHEPMHTITTKDRLGLVTLQGIDYQIVDIGMRMLEPHELLRAQFGKYADEYDLSKAIGKSGEWSKSEAVRLIGNSVCPEVAEALVAANTPVAIAQAA